MFLRIVVGQGGFVSHRGRVNPLILSNLAVIPNGWYVKYTTVKKRMRSSARRGFFVRRVLIVYCGSMHLFSLCSVSSFLGCR
jgi:hypothetical protein